MSKTYFISGHRDISREEFIQYYAKPITQHVLNEPNAKYVVGDYHGVDVMAQNLLNSFVESGIIDKDNITVYHMFTSPRNNPHMFKTIGGFTNDEDRDCAMTMASHEDIAWVRSGKKGSGTDQNIERRKNINNRVNATNLPENE